MVQLEKVAGQPRQAQHRPADRANQDRIRQMQYRSASSLAQDSTSHPYVTLTIKNR